ncbi:murein hydrolase activator EnvC family protein [Falsigemmobacter faecalis]|uniref:Peptidase M23 n=1 Tax=Falsigemmobacter faecalis TaxID=2488730 RepID=A0A3P3DW78_9RHOB|nr:peptidoglycan DD-metalloendopeptidase family protein [Falsigemmobacter faecalis]RRH78445.1 peptidase M23 [Falsigemmobacter faecalis]
MRRAALALCLALMAGGTAVAESPVSDQARAASEGLLGAVEALEQAESGRDQVAALTRTIQAYETGLSTLREALRQATIRETALQMRFEAKRERVSKLLGVLSGMDPDPTPLLMLHPSGPVGTARSGMMLAEITPAMQAEVETLRAELKEVSELRALQKSAGATLQRGLEAAQVARTQLSQAIAARSPLPKRFTEDPERLKLMISDADTLDALATGLAPDLLANTELTEFAASQGKLVLPVLGQVLRQFGEPDAAGIERPGLVIATRPQALVTAPWPSTIRYVGPFLDYGNVMILEPGAGYLLVLAGLGTIYGGVGDIVPGNAPVGLMGGADGTGDLLQGGSESTGRTGSETLYMELRQGGQPVDPGEWFADVRE